MTESGFSGVIWGAVPKGQGKVRGTDKKVVKPGKDFKLRVKIFITDRTSTSNKRRRWMGI